MKRNAAKKNTEQCFSTEINATCKNSAYLERKIKKKKLSLIPFFPLASSLRARIRLTYFEFEIDRCASDDFTSESNYTVLVNVF